MTDTTVEYVSNHPEEMQWRINASQPIGLEIYTFYWLGWAAEVDGDSVPITPSPNHGFITVPIPAGEHDLLVYLGSTPARDLGAIIATVALLGLASIGYVLSRQQQGEQLSLTEPMSMPAWRGIVLGGFLAMAGVVLLFRVDIAWLETSPGDAPSQSSVHYDLDDTFRLLGYDINNTSLSPGDTLDLDLYWYPVKEVRYQLPCLRPYSPMGAFHQPHKWTSYIQQGRAITEWWTPIGYIYDEYRVELPADTPVGEYQIFVGLYTCEFVPDGEECGNGYRPTVTNEDGEVLGDSIHLGTIMIE